MGKIPEQTFHQKRHMDSKEINENMMVIRHQRNADCILNDTLLYPYENFCNNKFKCWRGYRETDLWNTADEMISLTATLENSLVVFYKVIYALTTLLGAYSRADVGKIFL